MDINQLFAISQAGMDFEKARLKAASLNIANANTIQNGTNGFRPLKAQAVTPFSSHMALEEKGEKTNIELVAQTNEPRRVYQPSHPAADASGYLYYPNVNLAEEMSTLSSAKRAYEANVKIMNAINSMSLKALDIGKRN